MATKKVSLCKNPYLNKHSILTLADVTLLLLLLYIIKLIEPSAMKLINIQKDGSDSLAGTNSLAGNDTLAGQIFRLT